MREFDQLYSNKLYKLSLRAKENNWTKVNLVKLIHGNLAHYEAWRFYDDRAPQILDWCETRTQDEWCEFAGTFYFRNEQDALMFVLFWSSRK